MDIRTEAGQSMYRRSVSFLLMMAVHKLTPKAKVISRYSIHKGLYFELTNVGEVNSRMVAEISKKMHSLVEENLPIEARTVSKEQALEMYQSMNYSAKADLLMDQAVSEVKVYVCGDYCDYLYGDLAESTGELGEFALDYYSGGVVLRTPMSEAGEPKIHPLMELPKLTSILDEAERWASILHCDYVPDLNRIVNKNDFGDLVRVSEALHEKRIAQIADYIKSNIHNLRLITIAGPSSSGKTSFAQRLRIQLRVNGIEPIALSLDDYYVNREDTPKNERGEFDFEALEAIDIELFNDHLARLLAGESVVTPRFNFMTGLREWEGQKPLSIRDDQPIIIEGIHGLNERLTESVPRENKYKIYISALTPLSLDAHNRIPTTQARLLRRLVRDYKSRGFNGEVTLEKWASVREGEEKNIFPYQEEADVMFNSTLIYELAMLKKYAIPMLREIGENSPYFARAQELLDFCDCFQSIDDESDVPNTSILREFIGGSVFFKKH